MNFQELINVRQSVRKYCDKPVEREKIRKPLTEICGFNSY